MSQLLFVSVLVASLCTAFLVVSDRPIYNIAHMVNAVKQIDDYLGYGANALEADVTFEKDGTPKYFYHGIPCDVFRDCLRWAYVRNYVNALRERTLPGSPKFDFRLVLVMFDVKLNKVDKDDLLEAGQRFANTILIPLYEDNKTKMKVIISVPDFTQKDFIKGVLKQLETKQPGNVEKIGFDISWEEKFTESSQKETQLKKLGVAPGHAWLSSGKANFFSRFYMAELKAQVRYKNKGNYFSKVYAWTLDKKSTAKKYLKADLDGVIANFPDRVREAIEEINQGKDAGEKVRLATLNDNPFDKVI